MKNKQEKVKSRSALKVSIIIIVLSIFHYRNLLLPYVTPTFNVNHLNNIDITHPYFVNQTHHHLDKDPLAEIGLPTLHPSFDHAINGSNAMVALDIPYCSQLGIDVIRSGGNAADATVTVALCLGSINSHTSGIGGGSFILSRYENETISFNAREMAPAASFRDMYNNNTVLAKVGGLAVGIPGELAGLWELYDKHGSKNKTWQELFEPVIKLNLEGFVATPVLVAAINGAELRILSKVPQLKQNWGFLYNGDSCIKHGDIVKRPAYAKTLELIAKNGSSAIFYDPNGPIAQSLTKSIRNYLGIITTDDFAAYKVDIDEPISLEWNDHTIYSSGGVLGGLALVGALNFFTRVTRDDDTPALHLHKLIESFKWLALIRTRLGDLNTEKEKLIAKYTGSAWIDEILETNKYSDNTTFPAKHYNPKFELSEPAGTSHFSIVDDEGNAVSITTTVNLYFGLLVLDPETGIILNNQMDDFSIPNVPNSFGLFPSIYNYVAPFRRPLSSTSPTIITKDDKVISVIGAAGGLRIPTAILHAIIRLYFKGHSLLELIAYPRIHHQLIPEYVFVEKIDTLEEEYPGVIEELGKLGHDFVESGAMSAMNGIHKQDDEWTGVSDFWRKLGEARGF